MHRAFLGVLIVGLAGAASSGCEEIMEQCQLGCPDEGILEGNAAISGLASIDSFFGAVVEVAAVANGLSLSVRSELDALAATVGLEAGAPAADIRLAIEAHVSAHVDGGLTVSYQPPACEGSLEVTASAAAACDAAIDPGSAQVSCEGKCTIDASAQADCSAAGTLSCKGPRAQCEGSCEGSCDLQVAASCEGTCRGNCDGSCSVVDGSGNCAGRCEGGCQGTCELSAGGNCSGTCQGSCEVEAPSCEAGFEAKCEASAEANIECQGGCEGTVEPPSVSAECQATVEAKAEANVTCTPPAVDISWQWNAALIGDAQAQAQTRAEFKAWIGSAKLRLAGLLAARAKAEGLGAVGERLLAAADGAVRGAVDELSASADLKASLGAGCALVQLPDVAVVLSGSVEGVVASGKAIGEIVLAFGG